MRVLGVDPGIARTGVAVVEGRPGALRLVHAGCIETDARTPTPARLRHLLDAVEEMLDLHRPDTAAVEELFFATNRRSAMQVSEARGVILCALARGGLEVASYTPLQVKESVAGYGAATKPQVARITRALLGVESIPGPDDTTDACAVAVCHHHRRRLGARVPGSARSSAPTPALVAAVERARRAAAGRAGC